MKIFLPIFTLLLSSVISAQSFELFKGDTINKIDSDGRKQAKWVIFGKNKPGTCYTPEAKVEEGKYQDNRKKDLWVEYFCNGNLKSKLTFVNGRPDGYAIMYHENGKISEEGIWKVSKWVGNYKLYYDNGQVQHEFIYNQTGKREGSSTYYYENGQKAIEGNFVNGKEAGTFKEYYENGDVKAEKNFNEGNVDVASIKEYQPKKPNIQKSDNPAENAPKIVVKEDEKPNDAQAKKGARGPLNGPNVLYNKNKQITKDGIFKDNLFIEGKAYFYDENGILTRIAVYKNGVYVGDTQPEK
ncbi:MAG: toxin-antitoxin system YwqK family antitoxin [Bacteroidetes bacterium]|nr:toxin-antitoxin system YwqK family antitoxin [Bacteroidota bacterium]